MFFYELFFVLGSVLSFGVEIEFFYEYFMMFFEVLFVFLFMLGQFDDFLSIYDVIIRFMGLGMMLSYGVWIDGGMNLFYNDNDMDYSQGMFFELSYIFIQCDMSIN